MFCWNLGAAWKEPVRKVSWGVVSVCERWLVVDPSQRLQVQEKANFRLQVSSMTKPTWRGASPSGFPHWRSMVKERFWVVK